MKYEEMRERVIELMKECDLDTEDELLVLRIEIIYTEGRSDQLIETMERK